MFKSYKYRLYPNLKQRQLLESHFNACRFIYNWGLETRITAYQTNNKSLSLFDTNKLLTQLKQVDGYQWLKQTNSQALQSSLSNLDAAYTRFFRTKTGFPKFKAKKKAKPSFTIPQKISINDKKLFIPKFKDGIRIIIDRQFNGTIKHATISKTKTNKYFVSILIDTSLSKPSKPLLRFSTSLGIDLGLTHFLITSQGLKIDNPRFFREAEKLIKKLSRQLSKKIRGGKKPRKSTVKTFKSLRENNKSKNGFPSKANHRIN